MNFKLAGMMALFCGAFAVACGDSGSGAGGSGGSDNGGGPSDGGNGDGGTTNNVGGFGGTGDGGNVGPGGGGPTGACDDIGVCDGDGMDPTSGCFECSVIGDESVAIDGGICAESYVGCFGTAGECAAAEGGEPDCCALLDCIDACDAAGNANGTSGDTPDELNCICENDGTQCTAVGTGTCLGDHPAGFGALAEFQTCLFDDTCPVSCQ